MRGPAASCFKVVDKLTIGDWKSHSSKSATQAISLDPAVYDKLCLGALNFGVISLRTGQLPIGLTLKETGPPEAV